MDQGKALVSSRTFQVALVQAIIAVVVIFSTAYPGVGWLLAAKSVLDIVLRLITTDPIASLS